MADNMRVNMPVQFAQICKWMLTCDYFACLFWKIVQKELTNNPFGHGDFARTTLPGLQQADTRPLSTNWL